jgi:hypothetical protein
VWRDQLPISHLDCVSVISDINDTQNATEDSATNILSSTPDTRLVAEHKRDRNEVHAELSSSIGRRPAAPTNTYVDIGPSPSAGLEPIAVDPLFSAEVRQLLRHAESLRSASVTEGPQITELQLRLQELGPPEEVLQALQGIFRMRNEVDAALPEYDEGSGRWNWERAEEYTY